MFDLEKKSIIAFLGYQYISASDLQLFLNGLHESQKICNEEKIYLFSKLSSYPMHWELSLPEKKIEYFTYNIPYEKKNNSINWAKEKKLNIERNFPMLRKEHYAWLKSQPGGEALTYLRDVERSSGVSEAMKFQRIRQVTYFLTIVAKSRKQLLDSLNSLFLEEEEIFLNSLLPWSKNVSDYARDCLNRPTSLMTDDRSRLD